MTQLDELILVDEQDNEIGYMPKLEAHQKGKLHRAFSILLFNDKNEILLQKRADSKYHSASLWTNTCCSHPLKGENIQESVKARLNFEMGIDTEVNFAYKFIYKVDFENELTEHELDYVFIGSYSGEVSPNPDEVSEYKWISLNELRNDILSNPSIYTFWFKLIVNEHLKSFHFPTQKHPF